MTVSTPTASAQQPQETPWYEAPPTRSSEGIGFWQIGERGSPVLLVMGFGMSGLAWEPQVDGLRTHHRLAFFDHVGMCESRSLREGESRTMRELAEHSLSVLDTLGWDTAHIVGVSLGGMITQQMALLAPERFRSMTLIATTPGGPLSPRPSLQGLRGFLRANFAKTAEQRLRVLRTLLFPPEYLAQHDPDKGRAGISWKPAPLETRKAHLRAVFGFNSKPNLHKLSSIPTLIVRPGKDILIPPRESDKLIRLLPEAEVLDLPMGGHGVMWQCRRELNERLLEHFRKVDQGEATKG